MKTVNVSDLNDKISIIIEQAKKEDILLKLADGTEFMLVAVDEFQLEIAQTLKNKKLREYLDSCSTEEATISLDDVKKELGLD